MPCLPSFLNPTWSTPFYTRSRKYTLARIAQYKLQRYRSSAIHAFAYERPMISEGNKLKY